MAADALAEQRAIFDRLRIPYELLTPAEVHHRGPQVAFEQYESVFYEPAGGGLKARESMIPGVEAIKMGRAAWGTRMAALVNHGGRGTLYKNNKYKCGAP